MSGPAAKNRQNWRVLLYPFGINGLSLCLAVRISLNFINMNEHRTVLKEVFPNIFLFCPFSNTPCKLQLSMNTLCSV
jgi:hypothetical protein